MFYYNYFLASDSKRWLGSGIEFSRQRFRFNIDDNNDDDEFREPSDIGFLRRNKNLKSRSDLDRKQQLLSEIQFESSTNFGRS